MLAFRGMINKYYIQSSMKLIKSWLTPLFPSLGKSCKQMQAQMHRTIDDAKLASDMA